MRSGSDDVRRRWAVAFFLCSVGLVVGTIALTPGVAGSPGLTEDGFHLDVGFIVAGSVVVLVGLLLSWSRPDNAVGWLLALSGFLGALCNFGQVYGAHALVVPGSDLPLGTLALAISAPLWIPALFIPGTVLLVRYPTGRVSGRWMRRIDRAFITGMVLVVVAYATSDNAVTDEVVGHANPLHVPDAVQGVLGLAGGALALVGLVGIVVGSFLRLLRSGYPERQQLAWLFTAAAVAVVVVIFATNEWLGTVAFALIPVAIAVGVLRYRLLGIEVVVRRTLLYGGLTALVVVVFVAVTAALTTVMPTGPAPQVLAASLIAVGLVPVRDRLQHVVDRFVYGDSRDPWSALERLGSPLGGAASAELLPAVIAAVGEALRVPGVTVCGEDQIAVASWGEPAAPTVSVPLQFAGESLGSLAVGLRSGEAGLSRDDHRLLEAIGPLVAAVVHAGRLTADLAAERARVVDATQRERGRLRQDLHDGLGPSLTGVGLGLEALQTSLNGAPPRQHELVDRLRAEVRSAIEDVRRIIDDLRPSALDDADLVTALERRAAAISSNGNLRVDVDVAEELPSLPPDVEATVFRVVDEALTNVVRHAAATHCRVVLSIDDALRVEVCDDGVGLPPQRGPGGVGLQSMRQRAERLGGHCSTRTEGGGTSVLLEIPLTVT